MNSGDDESTCSIRNPVEKMPRCLLNPRMLLLGKLKSQPMHDRRNASGVAESVANGQVTLNIPSLAPPVCENVAVIEGTSPPRISRAAN